MDCCKAVSLAARYDGDIWEDFWAHPGVIDFDPLPLGVVVTVAGTGSECNGGAVITNNETLASKLDFIKTTIGSIASPFDAYLALRGMKTLDLRMARQCGNALRVAEYLENHPAIASVYYPGLPSHPQHALALRQQKTGGAIVAFEVKGDRRAAWTVVDHCRLLSITANLGDTKTTITHPASTTHGRITPEQRATAGITDGLLRIAVGLEAVVDLHAHKSIY